jgi:hypothetical protein
MVNSLAHTRKRRHLMTIPSPKYCTIEDWGTISGMSRRVTYEKLGGGELKAIKAGTRTLIDVDAGLAWLRSLPPAKIRAPRQRQQVAA